MRFLTLLGQWMPHITIGFGNVAHEKLSQIIVYLGKRSFDWKMTVDNVAIIQDTGSKQELRGRFALKVPLSNL